MNAPDVRASRRSLRPALFIHVDPMACKQFAGSIAGDVEGCTKLAQVCRQPGLMAGQGAFVQCGVRLDVDFQQFISPAVVQESLPLKTATKGHSLMLRCRVTFLSI